MSEDGKLAAFTRMDLLAKKDMRKPAKAFADTLKKIAYSGSEPHPDGRNAETIITLLRTFDEELEKARSPLAQAEKQLTALQADLPDAQRSQVKDILDNLRAAQSPLVVELLKA